MDAAAASVRTVVLGGGEDDSTPFLVQINASDVGAAIGVNRYQSVNDTLYRIVERFRPSLIDDAKVRIEEDALYRRNIASVHAALPEHSEKIDRVVALADESDVPLKRAFQVLLREHEPIRAFWSKNSTDIEPSFVAHKAKRRRTTEQHARATNARLSASAKSISARLVCAETGAESIEKALAAAVVADPEMRAIVKEKGEEVASEIAKRVVAQSIMQRGTALEDATVSKLETSRGLHIGARNARIFELFEFNDDRTLGVCIRGRIDGKELDSGKLIEIKNRKSGFRRLHQVAYELVQLRTYMRMVEGCTRGELVQQYDGVVRSMCTLENDDEEWGKIRTELLRVVARVREIVRDPVKLRRLVATCTV